MSLLRLLFSTLLDCDSFLSVSELRRLWSALHSPKRCGGRGGHGVGVAGGGGGASIWHGTVPQSAEAPSVRISAPRPRACAVRLGVQENTSARGRAPRLVSVSVWSGTGQSGTGGAHPAAPPQGAGMLPGFPPSSEIECSPSLTCLGGRELSPTLVGCWRVVGPGSLPPLFRNCGIHTTCYPIVIQRSRWLCVEVPPA